MQASEEAVSKAFHHVSLIKLDIFGIAACAVAFDQII